MPTDLEQQLARFAEALDREAPAISFDDMVGRGTVAVDVDLLERPSSDRASRVNGVPWITTPSHDEIGEGYVLIELAPAVAARRPAWRRVALEVALGVAAVVVLVVALAAIEWGGDELDPADGFPNRTTFVSPRNGFSVEYPNSGEVTVTPATDLWDPLLEDDYRVDVLETGSGAVFKGSSFAFPGGPLSIDDYIDEYVTNGCEPPRGQITIDGQSGRISEGCPNEIVATVVAGGRIYQFTLLDDRGDARAVFDAFAATIRLTPETAVDFPNLTTGTMGRTFVSPTYGYSFAYIDRGGLVPATELWDPVNQQFDVDFDDRFDAVETGFAAYFESASTEIPDGVSIDAWVDEYISPGDGCGVPRSEQAEITIDGQPGRIAECPNQIEATVVAGGRLYLFILGHERSDARAFFDAWVATIDLTPETAT